MEMNFPCGITNIFYDFRVELPCGNILRCWRKKRCRNFPMELPYGNEFSVWNYQHILRFPCGITNILEYWGF